MSSRDATQSLILTHCVDVFGPDAISLEERAARFFEEACELVQATGLSFAKQAHILQYVDLRAVGEPGQEIGGTMVTLMGLAEALDLSVEDEEHREVHRFFQIDPDAFRAKHAQKKAAGV